MKNTFYRPREVNVKEFENILQKMKRDLSELLSGNVSCNEVIEYARKLIADGKTLKRDHSMVFWGLGNPEEMPGDARVDFFYTPTYIAVSMLTNIMQKYPDLTMKVKGFEETLKNGLYAATGRSFSGHGFDDMDGLIDCLDIFAEADVFKFVKEYPDFCPEFTKKLTEAAAFLENKLATGKIKGNWGEDYSSKAASVVRKIKSNSRSKKIFVYGTLLRGNSNHDCYLKNSKFLGEAVLSGYGLYNISSYPGIKRKKGDSVKGELYEIDEQTLKRINHLEGEGSLYSLVNESVELSGNTINDVGLYVYMHDVNERDHVCHNEQPWREPDTNNKNLIWYAAYGSNMLYERFMCYLNGGQFRNNGKDHIRCSDTIPPRDKVLYELPFNMYYGNHSGSWDDKGVSFLDISAPGKAYGVAYLISEHQFEHIFKEENDGCLPTAGSTWYNKKLDLGTINNIPVMTITNAGIVDKVNAGERYLGVLIEGLKENYDSLSIEEINEYVISRNNF